jgi:ADP-ribose pyrophosphatase
VVFVVQHNLKWEILETILIADCKIFTVHCKYSKRPEKNEVHGFYCINPSNWVNVIPVTDDGQVVLIEQYRPGLEEVTLEIPGGVIDATDASSLIAAERELLEETGYRAKEIVFLGRNHPNPAIQNNYCDTYLAKNAKRICDPPFDGTEEIETHMVPLTDVPRLIKGGKITHALVIVAFHFLDLYQTNNKPSEFSQPSIKS